MAMVAAKCSECGASIEVNDARREGYCPFCGTKYVTQDIIQNTINNNYVTNNIGTAVIQGGDTIDAMYERFEAYIKLGDLSSSAKVVGEMREKFPQKALTWYCAALPVTALIGDEFKRARMQIDNYVAHADFPDPQKYFSRPYKQGTIADDEGFAWLNIRDIGDNTVRGLEEACPSPSDSRNAGELKWCLDAVRKFETAEDRTRYASVVRRVEEEVAAIEQKKRAFNEYKAAARRELEAKAAAWRKTAEEYLNAEQNRKAVEQKREKRRQGKNKIFRVIGYIVIAVIVVAVLIGILDRMF